MSKVAPLGSSAAAPAGHVAAEVVPLPHHGDAAVYGSALSRSVSEWLDDQTRLAQLMERPSAMKGGGRMTYEFDALRGQAVGSHIRMGGEAFGLRLFVDEVVTVREPPPEGVADDRGAHAHHHGAYEMGSRSPRKARGLVCMSGSTTRSRSAAGPDGFGSRRPLLALVRALDGVRRGPTFRRAGAGPEGDGMEIGRP